MTLTENQKHLIEGGLLVAGVALVWYLLHQNSGDATVQTLPPEQLQGATSGGIPMLEQNFPPSDTINFPGVGPVEASPPFPADPFTITNGGITFGGNSLTGSTCGCCAGPPASGDAFATPEQQLATIATVNPYNFPLEGLPGGAAATQSGLIVPGGASMFAVGEAVPISTLLMLASSPFPFFPPSDLLN